MPTDYWMPSYKSEKDIPRKFLLDYTQELSNILLINFGLAPISTKKSQEISKIVAVRLLLEELLEFFKQKVNLQVKDDTTKFLLLARIEQDLYDLLFMTKSENRKATRRALKNFLKPSDISEAVQRFTLVLEGLSEDYGSLREITLSRGNHYKRWSDLGILELFYNSLRLNLRPESAKDLSTDVIIKGLEEPITRLNSEFKKLALAKAKVGQKIYLVPTVLYEGGLAQFFVHSSIDPSKQNKHILAAPDIISVEGEDFRCFTLDGNNLASFANLNPHFIRGLLEGRIKYFVLSGDGVSFEHLGAIDILMGSISIENIVFSEKLSTSWHTFSISSFDQSFAKQFTPVLNAFKNFALPIVQQGTGIDRILTYIKFNFISDYFK